MPRKKTHQEYEEQLLEMEASLYPIESYHDAKTPIMHKCIEGHKCSVAPDNVLHGRGCNICSGKKLKTHEEYEKQLLELDADCWPLEQYISRVKPILHECIYGHTWKASPYNVLHGTGCPSCNRIGGYNKKFFEKNPEKAEAPGILYCIILQNKTTGERELLKIGITKGSSYKSANKRATGFFGYEPRIQKIVKGTLKEVFELEQELHKQWKHKRKVPKVKFPGWTECFSPDNEIIKSIPSTI